MQQISGRDCVWGKKGGPILYRSRSSSREEQKINGERVVVASQSQGEMDRCKGVRDHLVMDIGADE